VKTILIIDGAENCAYDHFQATDEFFALLFPGDGQDIEFIEDVWDRHAGHALEAQFDQLWARPVRKRDVRGIDGILFYGLLRKKIHYPNKKDSDLDATGRSWKS
jgi:hypothetical protein